MTEAQQIERLLNRAADVRPVSTQPTDDVLARAERAPRAWVRRHRLAIVRGVVACALLGGGVAALSTGDEQEQSKPRSKPNRQAAAWRTPPLPGRLERRIGGAPAAGNDTPPCDGRVRTRR